MRILVVEDEPTLAEQLAQAIAAAGHTVERAADGREACFLGAGPRCDELDARGGRADGDTEFELPGFGSADGGEVGGEFGDGGGGQAEPSSGFPG